VSRGPWSPWSAAARWRRWIRWGWSSSGGPSARPGRRRRRAALLGPSRASPSPWATWLVLLHERIEGGLGMLTVLASRTSLSAARAAGCADLGRAFMMLASLWTQHRWCAVSGNTSEPRTRAHRHRQPAPGRHAPPLQVPQHVSPGLDRLRWPSLIETSSLVPSLRTPTTTRAHSRASSRRR